MRSIFFDAHLPRVVLTQFLGRLRQEAYFGRLSPLKFATFPDPPLPGPRWVRVRNRLAGICGSDLHILFIDAGLDVAPVALSAHRRLYLGHEVVGEVVEVGPEVQNLRPGDRVVLQKSEECCLTQEITPPCRFCARGDYGLCENVALMRGPTRIGGGWGDGMVAHEAHLYKLPTDITDEQAVLIEPAAVGLRAVGRRLPQPGERVLVIGCGIIGLLTIAVLRAMAPEARVVAMARYPFQADAARRMGAHEVLLGQDGYAATQRLTGAKLYRGPLGNRMLVGGFDVIYDCVGNARTIGDALRWARARGTVVVIGVHLMRLKLDLTPVWYQEVDLIGSVYHGAHPWQGETYSDFDLVVRLLQEGKLPCDGLITHRFPLERYREAIVAASHKRRSQAIKVVFELQNTVD